MCIKIDKASYSKSIQSSYARSYHRMYVLSLQQKKMCDLDPNLYSYEFNDEGFLVAKIVDGGTNLEDFAFPRQCGK